MEKGEVWNKKKSKSKVLPIRRGLSLNMEGGETRFLPFGSVNRITER